MTAKFGKHCWWLKSLASRAKLFKGGEEVAMNKCTTLVPKKIVVVQTLYGQKQSTDSHVQRIKCINLLFFSQMKNTQIYVQVFKLVCRHFLERSGFETV